MAAESCVSVLWEELHKCTYGGNNRADLDANVTVNWRRLCFECIFHENAILTGLAKASD